MTVEALYKDEAEGARPDPSNEPPEKNFCRRPKKKEEPGQDVGPGSAAFCIGRQALALWELTTLLRDPLRV